MQFVTALISLALIIIRIDNGICSTSSIIRDMLQQGKYLFTRSSEGRWAHADQLYETRLIPKHGIQYHGLEFFKDDNKGMASGQAENLVQGREDGKKEAASNEIYRTDIIENDNMDLYRLLGGISFASLLATTLFILGRNRRNGSNARTSNTSFQNNISEDFHMYFIPIQKLASSIAPMKSRSFKGTRSR